MSKDVKYIADSNGTSYPLAFNLNVLAEIQEKYGSIEDWGKEIEPEGKEPRLKALIHSFSLFINEGYSVLGEDKQLTEGEVGRVLTDIGIKAAGEKIKEMTVESLPEAKNA